jgi:AraC-like DNA-binding protein
MRFILCLVLSILLFPALQAEKPMEMHDSEPYWFVYMTISDKHYMHFKECLPLFLDEIKNQGLEDNVRGKPFSMYLSRSQWVLACKIDKKARVKSPLVKRYFWYEKMVSCTFISGDSKMDYVLSDINIYADRKGYNVFGWPVITYPDFGANNAIRYEVHRPIYRTGTFDLFFEASYGIIKILITFTCLLFGVFLLSIRKFKRYSNNILGIFLLNCVVMDTGSYLWIYDINTHWPGLYGFNIPFEYLSGPLIYLFIRALLDEKFQPGKKNLIHFVPFLIAALYYIFRFQVQSTDMKYTLFQNRFLDAPDMKVIVLLPEIQFIMYLLYSAIIVYVHYFTLENKSDKAEKLKFRWLNILLIGSGFILFLDYVKHHIPLYFNDRILPAGTIVLFLNLVLFSVLIIFSLKHAHIFIYAHKNGNKYHKSPLREEHKDRYLKKLMSYMDETRSYLSSGINLPELAKEIAIPSRYISQVLNEKLEMSFYDFINKYRIEEAKILLSDPEYHNNSIIEIAYDCGFNSKSVFNAAFKKFTGKTPSEYRINFHVSVG